MDSNMKHYFLASHTGKGYVHFFDEAMAPLDYVYVLKSVPGNGQSELIQNIASHFEKKGERLDMIHQAYDADAFDGLILKDRNVGVLEGTAPHVLEPRMPHVDGEYVDLSQAVRIRDLDHSKREIRRLMEQYDAGYQEYSQALADMFRQHEELEEFYSGELDFEAADRLASDTIETIFGTSQQEKSAIATDRFFEASTESTHIDFVHELTKECTVRYFIKGRPGSGKSVFMKKIAEAARERGYDVERYHCGFDPDSLDLILLPELGVAAFDSTSPHDHEPNRTGDEIIDTAASFKVDPDEAHQEQIAKVKASSKEKGKNADEGFRKLIQAYQDMAELYGQAVDFDKVNEMENYIIEEVSKGN